MLVEIAIFFAVLLWWMYRRPSGFPPGPSGLPIVGYLPFISVDPHLKLQALAQKHGNIMGMRLGFRWVVVLSDHEAIKDAFKEDAFAARPHNPILAARCPDGEMEGLIMTSGRKWQEQRRFTMRHLRDFGFGKKDMEGFIQEELQDIVEKLRKEVGTPIDLRFRFSMSVLNSLWGIVAGEKFNADDPEMKQIIEDLFVVFGGDNMTLSTETYYPWLVKLKPSWYYIKEFKEVSERKDKVSRKIIQSHQKTLVADDPRDLIDVYLSKIESETDTSSSFYKEKGHASLIHVLSDLIDAGSETTSGTLYWTYLFMVMKPDIQRKVQEEVDEVVGRSRLPSLTDKASMPYTEAVISEILRHIALAPLGLIHEVTEDTVFKGYHIPKDTVVMPNMYAAQYDPKCWDNPDEFRPERFLTDDGKFDIQKPQIAFGNGKRACVGEAMARAELFLFITGLLQAFFFSSPEGDVPTLKANITFMRMAKTYRVILKER